MTERKGFNNIIPDQEDRIGQHRPVSTGKAPRQGSAGNTARHNTSSTMGGLWKVLVVILVLVAGGSGWFGWQQYQQLTLLQANFDDLTSRLALADESVNQSGAALQLKIQEQGDELTKHWVEIKKLWGISYDINKKQIAENQKIITSHVTQLGKFDSAVKKISAITKNIDVDRKTLLVLSGDALANAAELEALQMSLLESVEKLQVVSQNFMNLKNDLSGRLSELEDAVNSFNAYRRQVNQELLQLRKEISNPAAKTDAVTVSSTGAVNN